LWGCGWLTFSVDLGGVVFISVVNVFAMPLFFGSLLSFAGDESGLPLLKFGSCLFLPAPGMLLAIWWLQRDPEYLKNLRPARRKAGQDAKARITDHS
jgi:hypothetical protein